MHAQQFYFTNADTIPCGCKGYYSISDAGDTTAIFYLNETGRTIVRKELFDFRTRTDSLKYYENNMIREIKMTISSGNLTTVSSEVFEYTTSGKLSRTTVTSNLIGTSIPPKENEGGTITTYHYDSKGRPKAIVRKYRQDVDSLSFKQVNDSVALMKFFENGTMVKTGKRTYNKQYQVIDEVLENPSNGRMVHFKFKYNSKRQLLIAHRVKVVKGMVGFFGSEYYDELTSNSKIEFQYDKKSRRIKKIEDDRGAIYSIRYVYF